MNFGNKIYTCFLIAVTLACCNSTGEDKSADEVKTLAATLPVMEKTFPFCDADRVELVSFEFDDYEPKNDNYKIVEGRVSFDEKIIKERVILDKKQQQQLFLILNTETVAKDNTVADCYMPEHRLTFYDKEGKVIALLEVCLQCVGSRVSEGFTTVKLHRDKMNELKQFFRSVGIRHFSKI